MRMGIRKLNTRPLTRSITKLAKATGESKAELANESAKFVSLHAYKQTDKTTGGAIREELTSQRGPYTKAELILVARARRTGTWPKGKYAMRKAAKQFVTRQARTATWLKVGFLPAIRAFGGRGATAKRFQKFPGRAQRARRSLRRPVAIIEHLDRGFIERHPTLLQQAVNKQTRFTERLAHRKNLENIRRARQF